MEAITGLPYTVADAATAGLEGTHAMGIARENGLTGDVYQVRPNSNTAAAMIRKHDNTNALANNQEFIGTFTYFV